MSKEAAETQHELLEGEDDRIIVDNSNLSELKCTCDEAVERILTRPASSNAGPPPTASEADSQSIANATSDAAGDAPAFPPFRASHFHTDLRLVLGFTAATIMIGATVWAYFIEPEWEKNKGPCGIAVIIYIILSSAQTADFYAQGHTIFAGRRKMFAKRIETERLHIASPPLPKPVTAPGPNGRTTPPVYTLEIVYTRKSNGGKSLLRSAKETVTLGHLGEWFTEEGEFVEKIFEERLVVGLEKVFGQ